MSELDDAHQSASRPRIRWGAVVLLTLTAAAAFLPVTVAYGIALEYSDALASKVGVAADSVNQWWIGILLVVGLAGGTALAARRSRGRRVITAVAVAVVVVTLLGVPTGAVVGAHQKYNRFDALPNCVQGFRAGPAVPVVRAAQAGFAELDHPGPFGGGGGSGVDGCDRPLEVKEDFDVPAAYRHTLRATGWRIDNDKPDRITAVKDGQAFKASRDEDGSWWVWIGPAGLELPPTQAGEVTIRK